jgi:hypothetical protein
LAYQLIPFRIADFAPALILSVFHGSFTKCFGVIHTFSFTSSVAIE